MRLVQTSDSDELEAKPSVLPSSLPDGLHLWYVCCTSYCAYRYVHTFSLSLTIAIYYLKNPHKKSFCLFFHGYPLFNFPLFKGMVYQTEQEKSYISQYVICFTVVLGYHHSGTCQHCSKRNVGRFRDGIKTKQKWEEAEKERCR